jgi:HK97 family phage prohead protease
MAKENNYPNIEWRTFPIRELRVQGGTDDKPKITGYAAVFNELSDDLGGFFERIKPGAFSKTLQEADVRALFNHDSNYVLGRTRSKTLSLSEDNTGLAIEIDPPSEAQWVKDLLISMKRGDIDQMSFAFRTIRDEWVTAGEQIVRTLLEVELFDVSPVTYPAYPQTSAQVRAKLAELSSAAEFQKGQGAPSQETHPPAEQLEAQARHKSMRRRLDLVDKD